jgi:hypothetical protein
MPVNLRREGEKTAGNKIGIIQVELSPPTDDPYVRLRNIGFSLRNVRTMIDSVAPEGIESYTVITGLVAQLAELLRLSNTLPPMGNTLVSNVPGPKEHLYLKGARMEEMHPISTLPPSNLLNITLFSYAGQLYLRPDRHRRAAQPASPGRLRAGGLHRAGGLGARRARALKRSARAVSKAVFRYGKWPQPGVHRVSKHAIDFGSNVARLPEASVGPQPPLTVDSITLRVTTGGDSPR